MELQATRDVGAPRVQQMHWKDVFAPGGLRDRLTDGRMTCGVRRVA